MNILVTAGGTSVPIDSVRRITNFAKGTTGNLIAQEALNRGHAVTLLTSCPGEVPRSHPQLNLKKFEFFNDYYNAMKELTLSGQFKAIILTAAVSDYACEGVFSEQGCNLEISRDKKTNSTLEEIWLQLKILPKVVGAVREEWNFTGVLVAFKLEAGIAENELIQLVELAQKKNQADFIVGNLVENSCDWAWVGPIQGNYRKIERSQLPGVLLALIETKIG